MVKCLALQNQIYVIYYVTLEEQLCNASVYVSTKKNDLGQKYGMVKCLALQNQIYLILCYFRGTAMQRISLRQHQEE